MIDDLIETLKSMANERVSEVGLLEVQDEILSVGGYAFIAMPNSEIEYSSDLSRRMGKVHWQCNGKLNMCYTSEHTENTQVHLLGLPCSVGENIRSTNVMKEVTCTDCNLIIKCVEAAE